MSIDRAVREAVAGWQPATAALGWDDVLRRARPRRRVPARPALVAAVALLALVVALPGVGLTRLFTGDKRPGLAVGATLVRPDGTDVGSFTLRMSRLFGVARNGGRPFAPTGKPRGFPVRWRLSLVAAASSARIVRGEHGATLALLCKPCAQGATAGAVRLRRGTFSLLFGRASVVVTTGTTTARGRIRLQRPHR
jgi:hypothetical protein